MVRTNQAPIPVTVIGGFLGAGKTTLVNHILSGDHGLKVAVMVNDFGAINIDAALIASTEGGLFSLSNGCVCCGLNQGLVEQIEALLAARMDIDHIVIEASGVADPARIMDTVRYARFAGRLRADAIVVVVDAAGFDDAMAAAPGLAEAQVASADRIPASSRPRRRACPSICFSQVRRFRAASPLPLPPSPFTKRRSAQPGGMMVLSI